MTKNQFKDQTKNLIIETVQTEKPQTTQQLIKLMQDRHSVSPEQTKNFLIELENENKLHFTHQDSPAPASPKAFAGSRKALWYWAIVALAAATVIAVFVIPENAYPIVYVRNVLGIIFVLLLPGYAFLKALFPAQIPVIKTTSEGLDNIERIALSLGLSITLVPIVGLILNYTPWGIRLVPITLSLLALTLVSATAALLREHQTITQLIEPQAGDKQSITLS